MINDDLKTRTAANREALATRQQNKKIQDATRQALEPIKQEKDRTGTTRNTLPRNVQRDPTPAALPRAISASILHVGNGIYTPGIDQAELFWDLLFADSTTDEYADVYYQEGIPELYTLRSNGVVTDVSISALQFQNNQLLTFNRLTTVAKRNTIKSKKWVHVTAKQLVDGTPNTYTVGPVTFYGYNASVSEYDAFPITLPATWDRSDTLLDDVVTASTSSTFNTTVVFISGALHQSFYHFGPSESPRVFQHNDPDVSLALAAPGRSQGFPPIGYYYSGVDFTGSALIFNNYLFPGRDSRNYNDRPPLSKLTSLYSLGAELSSVANYYADSTSYEIFDWGVVFDEATYYDTVRSILQSRKKYVVQQSAYVNPVYSSITPAALDYRLEKPFWYVGIDGFILPWTFYAVIESKPVPGAAPGAVAWDTAQIAYFWFLYMADNAGTFIPFNTYLSLVSGFPWLVELLYTSVQEVRAFYPKTYLAYLFG